MIHRAIPQTMDSALAIFAASYDTYARAIQRIDPIRQPEALLICVKQLAYSAEQRHPGRFADGTIENPLLVAGQHLPDRALQAGDCTYLVEGSTAKAKRRVLHIATTVLPLGGHTRTIENWVSSDTASHHALLLTNQGTTTVREELLSVFNRNQGAVIRANAENDALRQAQIVRAIAKAQADLVVLHTSPHDVIPSVAFAVPESPPVALLNHADHVFWLGSTVADAVINLRGIGQELSERRRSSRGNCLLPIPLTPVEHAPPKAEARRRLGVGADEIIYLTTGRRCKYQSTSHGNFLETATRILNAVPLARLLVLGVDRQEATALSQTELSERIVFLGQHPSSLLARSAADIYLEGFPFGSQTAALEAGRSGLPVVLAFAPPTPLLATNAECFHGVVPATQNEEGYIQRAVQLGIDHAQRINEGRATHKRVAATHTSDGWLQSLSALYDRLQSLSHAPQPIAETAAEFDSLDARLADWQAQSSQESLNSDPAYWAFHDSYLLRWSGQYRHAHILLRALGRERALIGRAWLALGKLHAHRLWDQCRGNLATH